MSSITLIFAVNIKLALVDKITKLATSDAAEIDYSQFNVLELISTKIPTT